MTAPVSPSAPVAWRERATHLENAIKHARFQINDGQQSAAFYNLGRALEEAPAPSMVGLREKVARLINPSAWAVMDSQFEHVMHSHRSYEIDKFKHKESLAVADAILTLLAREGV